MVLDVILVAVMIACAAAGLKKGLVQSLAEFAGALFALLAAAVLSGAAASLFCDVLFGGVAVTPVVYAFIRVIAAMLLFVALQVLTHLCARALDAVFQLPLLHLANCLAGALFGLLRGGVLVLLACTLLQLAPYFLPSDNQSGALRRLGESSGICRYVNAHNPLYRIAGVAPDFSGGWPGAPGNTGKQGIGARLAV